MSYGLGECSGALFARIPLPEHECPASHGAVRDLAFGIALGFGLMSSGDFIVSSLISRVTSLADPVQFLIESLILVTLAMWVVYSVLPEPAPKPVLVAANSILPVERDRFGCWHQGRRASASQ